ncbi:MAG: iron-containing alcohol dehydrogenase, partial [Silvanigrellaceae bacterium]|nr:iron-containing alcohol dehydrogenase [Silvanigrellaceae bacterium]
IEESKKVFLDCEDYNTRANLMWCATTALNGTIGLGVPQDWATHSIGHQLTMDFGLDHAQSLAVILPSLLKHQFFVKKERLATYGKNVWCLTDDTEENIAMAAINKTEAFFRSIGARTRLEEYGIQREQIENLPAKIMAITQAKKLGEHKRIGEKEIAEILELAFDK